jgi:hypothetical protein
LTDFIFSNPAPFGSRCAVARSARAAISRHLNVFQLPLVQLFVSLCCRNFKYTILSSSIFFQIIQLDSSALRVDVWDCICIPVNFRAQFPAV